MVPERIKVYCVSIGLLSVPSESYIVLSSLFVESYIEIMSTFDMANYNLIKMLPIYSFPIWLINMTHANNYSTFNLALIFIYFGLRKNWHIKQLCYRGIHKKNYIKKFF